MYSPVLGVERCAELVPVFSGIGCEALRRYRPTLTISGQDAPSASVLSVELSAVDGASVRAALQEG